MTTLAELKALDTEVCDAVDALTYTIQKAQRAGLLVELDSMTIEMVGCPAFTQFKVKVRAPMDLLESLES